MKNVLIGCAVLSVVLVIGIAGYLSSMQSREELQKSLTQLEQKSQAEVETLKAELGDIKDVALKARAEQEEAKRIAALPKNIFSFARVKVGDMVQGMKLVTLTARNAAEQLSAMNAVYGFEGEVTVSGTWDRREFGGDKVCMSDLTSGAELLPKLESDTKPTWFCFSNDDVARRAFKPLGAKGTATVVIDQYTYSDWQGDQWNSAMLKKVVDKTVAPAVAPATSAVPAAPMAPVIP